MQSEGASATERLKPWAMGALVFGLVLACYWPALRGGMLWDDQAHVTRPELRSWSGLVRIWIDLQATQQYYPVAHSAFWIEHRLWGDATIGYHLVNVFWHATSCCLLALLLRRLWRSGAVPRGTEWLAALIFAVHPVCVESVAWIAEQKNTLSLVFYLLAALAYLNFDERRALPGRPARGSGVFYALALMFFLLALGTKSVTATLPAALLVVLWWKKARLSWRDVVPLIPWFAAALAAGLFTSWIERYLVGAQGAAFDLSAGQRVLLAGRVIWFYLGKLFWPTGLIFIYPRWDVAVAAEGWHGCLIGALAATAALGMLARRSSKGPLAGWLFFVGSLFPALGFFNVYPFIFSYVADHFQYLASLGVIATIAAGIGLLLARAAPPVRVGGWLVCGVLIAGLAWMSNRQSRAYRDAITLYRATLAGNPDCWMAHNNLGNELAKTPSLESEAIVHYEQALRIKPDYEEAHNNLAFELEKLPGHASEALAHYEQALRIDPDYANAHLNMANELATLPGREADAIAHYQEALRLEPDSVEARVGLAEAYNNLAIVYANQGRMDEAREHWQLALRLKPDDENARWNLERLQRLTGK
jgi:tetratricopeptide (TPR) repeat protein